MYNCRENSKITNLSELCKEKNKDIWKKTLKHPMLKEMADGSLAREKFTYYMIQDYFYLLRYIDVFSVMFQKTDSLEEKEFISRNISDLLRETKNVHIPKMKNYNILDTDIKKSKIHIDIFNYTSYMKEITEKYNYLAGLVAILNCSWSYAYLAQEYLKICPKKIEKSSYKEWFFYYASQEYLTTNKELCDRVDRLSKNCSEEEIDLFVDIFYNCAKYELRLWDMFYLLGENFTGGI